MIYFKKSLPVLAKTLLFSLLLSLVCLTGSFAYASTPGTTTELTQGDSVVSKERVQRIGAVEECRKYLKNGDNKTTANLDKPLDKMGNKRVVGALKASDNPEPTPAEVEFKRCLEEQGVAPEI
ncbi:hypothetical protein NG798_00850 [Ancylothrix sp. C2]|uniref:hypothetical protein n=1 Tax=Ancylothrix sp. D3o TaxID=2953691 RepID=UPI0021BA5DB2|nr:hypothetical protein [Ancylothrix sp. D3o]MCT7948341.1 hypothetical protein [Ancylothrix sp. D3o]